MKITIPIILVFLSSITFTNAQNAESQYYSILNIPLSQEVIAEVGGVCALPNGSVAISTRRGDIFLVENPSSNSPVVRKFAEGLHEILGLRFYKDAFYCTQRSELTKIQDLNGDGKADRYETVASWPLTGNYHEYSYGPIIDDEGKMFVTLNLGFFDPDWWRGRSNAKWRGWTLRIDPETGDVEPWATGMRSPCGIGLIDGEFFYADNQGDWHGSGGLVHVEKGDFTGHPGGLVWADDPSSPVKMRDTELYAKVNPRFDDGSGKVTKPENIKDEEIVPFFSWKDEFPSVKSPAVWLPHGVLGISTSEIVKIPESSGFGPFGGQVLIGDQGQSKISRVFLEKVNGVYQGGAILFREGFSSGVLRMVFLNDELYVGQTNRGWGSTGPLPYGLERVVWSGKMPFEMLRINAMPDGFEVEFTQPVDKSEAENLDNYQLSGFIYKYHPVYGSPAVNQMKHAIKGVKISEDGKKVRIVAEGLREHYVHELVLNLKNESGQNLLHETAFYTLNQIPEGGKLSESELVGKTHKMNHGGTQKVAEPVKKKEVEKPGSKKAVLAKRTTTKPKEWAKVDKVVRISTKPGLKYDIELITAKAGERIQIIFNNPDDMPHNILFVNPGKGNEIGVAAIKLGVNGLGMDYVPESDDVLFHTKLLQPGSSDTIYIQAPDTPGDYAYVCTYPGHYISMKGVLRVVK
ncbi:MAG: plastocyanin/azurin family copper-binding protein [Cyclobacteriaceae bacterium]|nr:plastocyanin/azurin family copper-binding protein [Cyclobacteriaceae bacterium]